MRPNRDVDGPRGVQLVRDRMIRAIALSFQAPMPSQPTMVSPAMTTWESIWTTRHANRGLRLRARQPRHCTRKSTCSSILWRSSDEGGPHCRRMRGLCRPRPTFQERVGTVPGREMNASDEDEERPRDGDAADSEKTRDGKDLRSGAGKGSDRKGNWKANHRKKSACGLFLT